MLLQVHLRKIGRFHKKEREMVAYHEAGHTIVGLVLSNARVVHKVTIVPRGRAGGLHDCPS